MTDLVQFLKRFRPHGSVTYVAITPDGGTIAETFNGTDQDEAAAWIEWQNRRRGLYFTVNPTPAGLTKKPSKGDIAKIAAVWADVDPLDANGRTWADERARLQALAEELHAAGAPPTFIVDSGNGIQPVWLLADPIEATPEFQAAAESLCTKIEHALGAQGTHNVDRLLRVPGTVNFPNARKRELGRAVATARLLRSTWQRYSWTELEALAERLKHSPPAHAVPVIATQRQQRAAPGENLDTIPRVTKGLRARFNEALADDAHLRARWQGAPPNGADTSRSAFDLSLATYMKRHGFMLAEYAAIAAKWEYGKGAAGTPRDYERCWARAGEGLTASTAFTASDTPPWPDPLGKAAFHGLAGEVVRAIEPHSEADPAALLLQFLAAFGNACGRGHFVMVEADQHPAVLWPVLVGDTSKARKGTAWSRIRQLLACADQEWLADRLMSGLSSGEGLIDVVRDPIMARVKNKEGEYVEQETDAGVADKRAVVVEAEFASTLRHFEREGNTLSPTLRCLWDTGDARSLTKSNKIRTSGAVISVIGHITVDELKRYLTRTEMANGLANRFLFLCVRRSKVLPFGGGALDQAHLIRKIETCLGAVHARPERFPVGWTLDAADLWREVYPELSAGRPGLVGAATSRAEAQVIRLALVYCLLDGDTELEPEHVQAALEVWRYCDQSALHLFGASLGDPVADELLRALKANPLGLSRNDIRELFNRNRSSASISAVLATLLARGLVRSERLETGGRPAERWFAA